MKYFYDNYKTPLGKMEITATEDAVVSIDFVDSVRRKRGNKVTEIAKQQMLEYFSGDRMEFGFPMAPVGTDFQKKVWKALTKVKYGETCSYSDIANKIKNPKAVRAVGSANGENPMTIVVPCHRVIGRDGSLTGYASGTQRKAWLLKHESGKG